MHLHLLSKAGKKFSNSSNCGCGAVFTTFIYSLASGAGFTVGEVLVKKSLDTKETPPIADAPNPKS